MNWKCDFCETSNPPSCKVCVSCSAWKCPNCGTNNVKSASCCIGCSWSEANPIKLVSSDTGKAEVLRANLDVTQNWLKGFAGEDAQYACSPQFKLLREENQWLLEKVPRAKNPTFVNGTEPSETRSTLKNDDVISIGSRKGNPDKLRITVILEDLPPIIDLMPPVLDS
jgi:hypothetical protein